MDGDEFKEDGLGRWKVPCPNYNVRKISVTMEAGGIHVDNGLQLLRTWLIACSQAFGYFCALCELPFFTSG